MAKAPLRKPKKKVCEFCKSQGGLHRLQGHGAATALRVRPRKDPGASRLGQLQPAPARHRGGGQEQPRDGIAAVLEHGSLRPVTSR